MKNLLSSIFFILLVSATEAQTIKGTVRDAASKKALVFATVTVFNSVDTSLITYRLTNPQGLFSIPQLPIGQKLRVVISYESYQIYRQEFTLTETQKSLNLDTISLAQVTRELKEVIIKAETPPVIVRKDTIEFNAASFRTLPNALVEDLLRKLPGIIIDENGNITVNGRVVNKIMVDGRDFFSGDPKMASRNLPANIIDKVQVTADKEQLEADPFLAPELARQVINLKLKRLIKKSWFGRLAFGSGTNGRYEASGILNHFRDTLQISLLGFGNNINKGAFGYDDLTTLGGFRRSGINNINFAESGSVSLNNISFGGTGSGIQTARGGGLNLNHDLGTKLNLNFQYFIGSAENVIQEMTDKTQLFADTIFTTRTSRQSILSVISHKLAGGLKWRPTASDRLEFKPVFTIANQHNSDIVRSTNQTQKTGIVNSGYIDNNIPGTDISYNHSLAYFRTYKKAGRSFNITNTFSTGSVDVNQYNLSADTVYTFPVRTDTISQLRDRDQNNTTTSLTANYFEPLSKTLGLRLSHSALFSNGSDNLITLDRDFGTGKIVVINLALSNEASRKNWRHNPSATLNWRYKQLTVNAGLGYLRLDLHSTFRSGMNDITQKFNYLLPNASLAWKKFNVNYSTSVIPPSLAEIQPVPDNTNSLYIIKGNPALEPTVIHNVGINYFKNNPQTLVSTSFFINGAIKNDAVIQSRYVDRDGKQVISPFNKNGLYNYTIFGSVDKQLKLKNKLSLSFRATISYIRSHNYLLVNNQGGYFTSTEIFPVTQIRMNWKDMIELTVSGNKSYVNASYENPYFNSQKIQITRLFNALVFRWPKNIVWDWDLTYRHFKSGTNSLKNSYALLNGGVTYVFLKDNKGQLRLSVYDLLNRNLSIASSITDNITTNSQNRIINRFGLLTFTYDIRNTRVEKVGPRERLLLF